MAGLDALLGPAERPATIAALAEALRNATGSSPGASATVMPTTASSPHRYGFTYIAPSPTSCALATPACSIAAAATLCLVPRWFDPAAISGRRCHQ